MAIAHMPPARTKLLAQDKMAALAMPAMGRQSPLTNILTALHLRMALAIGAAVTAFVGTLFTALSAAVAYKVVQKSASCAVADLHESANKKLIELMPTPPEPVSFYSEDGLRIDGTFFAGTAGSALVLCHGFRACSLDLMGAAAELNHEGHSILVFDFRGHGKSGGKRSSIGYKECRDLRAAVQYLKNRPEVDPQRIGVLGISMGAATAILTAAECQDIKAIVADSSFATLHDVVYQGFKNMLKLPGPLVAGPTLMFSEMFAGFKTNWVRPIDAVSAIAPRPILFIHSRSDDLIAYEHCNRLYEAAAEPKQQWLVDGAMHARAAVMYHDEYVARVSEFFKQNLAA
jgi:fermentation-respiration switch protein FrsA (DUF1100 family)